MCNKHFEGTAYIRNHKYELLNLPEPPQVRRFIPGAVPTLHPPIIDLPEAAPNCNEDGHGNLEGTPVTADRMSPEQKNLPEAAPNCNEDGHGNLEGTPVTADRMSPEQKIRRGTKRCFEEFSVVANDEPFQMGADVGALYRKIRNLQCELVVEKREKERIFEEKKKCEELVTQLRKELDIVSIKVRHSQSLNEEALRPWFAMEKEGPIIAAHCSGVAGLGEACSHVAATMFAVESGANWSKKESCTPQPCGWVLPSCSSFKSAPLAKIDFTSPATKYKNFDKQELHPSSCATPRTKKQLVSMEARQKFLETLKNSGIKSASLSLIPGCNEDLIPEKEAWCYCRKGEEGDMVLCCNKECKVRLFHLRCPRLTKVPKRKWLCKICSAKKRSLI
ncbi:hypothetical protein Pcinc_006047 [Petrolisthes cinctipes]|uniref:Zinc finger PHD-type domain-containing protein n=1 Tax=Petrolisthes cinctipes TaxID=88211 RepID=A0AAE1GI51_PETCI|nr:hypothetical protein Pcinc_006047 [Petrolisthes cinctipes]